MGGGRDEDSGRGWVNWVKERGGGGMKEKEEEAEDLETKMKRRLRWAEGIDEGRGGEGGGGRQ